MHLSIFRPYGDKTKATALGFKPVVEMKPSQYEETRMVIEFTPQPTDNAEHIISIPDKITVSFQNSDEARAFAVELLQTLEAIEAGEYQAIEPTPMKKLLDSLAIQSAGLKKIVKQLDEMTGESS